MTVARSQLVDVDVTRYYHCISRCVRHAFLCGQGYEHRKQWIEQRLQRLSHSFAVSICGFAVMDNHLHVLVRLDPDEVSGWSDEQVVRRWLAVYPPRTMKLDDPQVVDAAVRELAADEAKVQTYRQRLANLGWFMKALKEPLARLANKEDQCSGTFWASRYKSIAILDEEALLATCAYIDLNPVAAGVAATPETSRYTSVRQRIAHVRQKGKLERLRAARQSSAVGSRTLGNIEQDHWLCPLDDRRRHGAVREGMIEGFSVGSYLLLIDYSSRLFRQGKARVNDAVQEILDRLQSSSEVWQHRLEKLLRKERHYGSYFGTDRQRLRELADRTGRHHLPNLDGCQA